MNDILFYDEWQNAIKTNDHKVFKRFMQEMCDDQMHYFDDNIEKWHELYLELDKENLNNIENIWGEGFALYKTYIDVSVRFSEEYLKYIEHNKRFQDRHDGEMLFTALRYINGRAIQVANEILVLLKNGYADAAYARRRTLYELSIVADFLVKYGDDVAKAYIEYDGQWCDWAKNVIPKKGRITFSDIEKKCSVKDEDIDLWDKENRISNKLVHASPQGTFSRFNIKERMKVIPIGPSPEGIVTAAVNSIESLYHMNCMYFGWKKDVFALVFMTVLNGLKQKVFEKFDALEKDYLEKVKENTSTTEG